MSTGEMGNMPAALGYPSPRVSMDTNKRRRPGLKKGEEQMGVNQMGQFEEQHLKDKKGLGTHSGLGTGDGLAGTYSERQERLAAVIEMMVEKRNEYVTQLEIEPGVMIVNQPEGPEAEYAEGEPEPTPKYTKKDSVKSHREAQVPHDNADFAEKVKSACYDEEPGDNKMAYLQGMYGEKKADKDYDGDGKLESGSEEWKGARNNAIKKRKKAERLGIDVPHAEKKGLWANIHAKRERIKKGSGERMRKPGDKGAPSAKDLRDSKPEED
jgi:hypothetical protein